MFSARRLLLFSTSLWLLALASPLRSDDPGKEANARKIDVMTANVYLGADLFRILDAGTPEEVPFTVAEIFSIVQMTDFPARAEAIADAVAKRRPHVIGLQEVCWYRTGAFDPSSIGAEDTVYDFLQLLMDALAQRGLDYQVAGVVQNADMEAPMVTATGLLDLRLTDRDVILVRGDVQAGNAVSGNYAENAGFPLAGEEVEFLRGWVMLPVEVMGRTYLVVNTHLETRLSEAGPEGMYYQFVQAVELLQTVDVLNGTVFGDLPVILVGDPDSDPGDAPYGPLVPPYQVFTGAEYIDTWSLRQGPLDPGRTCCLDEYLVTPEAAFYERIDHIFFRGGDAPVALGPVQSEVIGDAQVDKCPSGLWFSDHGFVSASLKQRGLKH